MALTLTSEDLTAIVDAIFNASISGYTTSGTLGAILNNPPTNLLLDSTIQTVTSQTEFIVNNGTTVPNAYADLEVVFFDASSSNGPSVRRIVSYDYSTRKITIDLQPDFTVIAGDGIRIFLTHPDTAFSTSEIHDALDSYTNKSLWKNTLDADDIWSYTR